MHGDEPGGPIRWRMHIRVPRARVWDALTTDAGRAAFWAESAVERDGAIDFVFANGFRCRGRVLERAAPARFALEYFDGVASFDLAASGAEATDLLLTHVGVERAHWHEVHAGWLNVLFPLKAWLAFGVDLRNHDAARTWDDGYADQ
jgi:uncharacterized protein YndB with AHSA1/START domain